MDKIAWISHSLINPRQHRFVDFFEENCGVEVLQVYPEEWGEEMREGGYEVYGESMMDYVFNPEALLEIVEFGPDLIYLQNELFTKVALQVANLCKQENVPLAVFIWENLRDVPPLERKLAGDVDLVVCGNRDAEKRLPGYVETEVCPQVGIDTDLFTPGNDEPSHDLVFPSRPSPEKGFQYLEEAVQNTDLSIHRPWEAETGRKGYTDMPEVYREGEICVQPSVTQKHWMEQFNYSVGEALSCGLSAVVSDCGSMPEVWGDCEAVQVVPERDVEALRDALKNPATPEGGRQFVKDNYGFEAVANRLTKCLEPVAR